MAEWRRPTNPPPQLFTGQTERDFVKQINDEIIERVIGQTVAYYPIDLETTEFHDVYGEAVEKNFLNPIVVKAMVKFESHVTTTNNRGIDRIQSILIYFHKRRLTEDQNLFIREGDFVKYGDLFYEIKKLTEGRWLFGHSENSFQIEASCRKARKSLFEGR